MSNSRVAVNSRGALATQIPERFSNEQLGQVRPSAILHFPQNFMPAGFSNSHFRQRIGSPHSHWPMREYRPNAVPRKQALEGLNG
jgi:hypothetical protein